MTMTKESQTAESLADRVFESVLGTLDLYSIYLGDHLGYYEILDAGDALTPAELAVKAGTDERYVREWLEGQAVSGLLEVVDGGDERRFALPSGHAEALTDRQSLAYVSPLARQILVSGFKLGDITEAHRSGGGVSWNEFGDEMRDAQGDLNRPVLENVLAQEWFSAVPEIKAKLVPGSRVADIGTGHGWASIGIARTFQGVTVEGFDIDGPSIDSARLHAAQAGVDDRVAFHAIDAGDPWIDGEYDLVFAIEMIHDLPDPIATLSTMKRIAAEDGVVIVADMNVSPSFDPDAGDLERLMYGFSNFLCLPDGKAHGHTVATGTVMRPSTLKEYAVQAGFTDIVELPIEADFWKFYRLV